MTSILAAAGAFLVLFALFRFWFFFRDPERVPPPGGDLLSPADGFVVYVHEVVRGEVPIAIKQRRSIPLVELTGLSGFGERGLLIGVYMTSLDVHVNRAPLHGRIVRAVRTRARRNLAMARMFTNLLVHRRPYETDCEHLVRNERHTIVIEGSLTVAVTQIADVWASQIICNVREGDTVERGARFGMIRMGSQVDLYISDAGAVEVACAVGQHVSAGTTLLARVRGA
jgi:phosphatidylserine decarboxylase